MNVKDKIILVTGGANGIGKASRESAFSAENASVGFVGKMKRLSLGRQN